MVRTLERDDRLSRRRDARREEFLVAASELAAETGIEGLTMKLLAERVDCAIGTAYTYFPSKGSLVAAVQAEAIGRLADTYGRAAPGVEPMIDGLDPTGRALARLVAFGRFVVAAERVMTHDFHLQRQLLGSPMAMEPVDADSVVPIAFSLVRRPQALIVAGSAAEALDFGADDTVGFERAVTWLAAVNGVLTLDAIQAPAAGLFDTSLMADRLTLDLLKAWGATPDRLDAAAALVPLDAVVGLLTAAVQPTGAEAAR